jgi:hypothetical protein
VRLNFERLVDGVADWVDSYPDKIEDGKDGDDEGDGE